MRREPGLNAITNRPEPVMNASWLAGALITLVKLAIALSVSMGWVDLTDNQTTIIVTMVAIVVDIGIVVGSMWVGARGKVTPIDDPKAVNVSGNLVELSPTDGSKLKDDWR